MTRIRLTVRELKAIQEALGMRLAGEIDNREPDTPAVEDYETAHGKVTDMLTKRGG